MRETLVTRETAHALLEPHLEAIRSMINQGWSDWHAMQAASPRPVSYRTTSRANIVYDNVTNALEAYFTEQGATTSRQRQYLEIVFPDERLVLRFKKFRDGKLRTSGIATQHRRLVDQQQAAFEGMEVTHAVIGYLPDPVGIELDEVAIVCWFGDEQLWQIDLPDSAGSVPIPVRTVETDTDAPPVRSTRPAAKEATNEE